MHLKLLFILIGALGTSLSSSAQGGFSKLYLEGLGTNSILYDHPYILTAAQIANTNGDRGLLFMKMSNTGAILDTDTFFDDSLNVYSGFQNCMIKTNSGYVVAGRRTPEAMLLKLDTNLKVLDTIFFQFSGEWTSALSLTEAANSDLLVTGTVYWLDTIRQERRKGFLAARFDAQLNLKWIKRFHAPSVNGKTVEQQAHNIMEDYQGNIWMGGYRQYTSGSNDGDVLVMALDSSGSKFFEQTYGDTLYDEAIATLIETPDSNYLIATVLGVSNADFGSYISSKSKIRAIKIQKDGTVLWDKVYGPSEALNYVVGVVKTNGGYIIGGHYRNWDGIGIATDGWYRSYVFKIGNNGDSLWYRDYAHASLAWDYNRILDIKATDEGIIAGGYFQSQTSPLTGQPGSHVWIVRTDSMGCVVQGCQYISTKEPIELAGITVYPNPAQTYFKVQGVSGATATVKVYDVNGHEVLYQPEIHHHQAIPLSNLPKGLYLVQVLQKEQVIHSQKLMVQP